MILAGDIGGTKTLLALYNQGQCVSKRQYASGDFLTFTELLETFLRTENKPQISAICLGVAGPVVDGDCIATNLPWTLLCHEVARQTGCSRVKLLNDLEAMAWGILTLAEDEFIELNPSAKQQTGNIAVLAAGTGLGEAIIAWTGEHYHVMPTEGGHTDFGPLDDQEIALLNFLSDKYQGHVSYERVASGMGIENIYQFFRNLGQYPLNPETEALLQTNNAGAVISRMAHEDKDPICKQTMNLFVRIYGAEAGNFALKTLAFGGVVLAGGIAAKNLSFIQKGEFMQRFIDKGRYRSVLQSISVKVCTNADAALLGAYDYATKLSG